ncbi:glutathione S-transferase family protein [Endozoicomonas sp. SM1973]|uniref:Glutathione S-transferase family protein n=1 Tax=Spartinivicinus marinus TaxID=2994442 RepID=A0A853HTK4_9GAMM|nr:glutathione S-transferase family protein [Spartinivicinus marinus]MCX4026779.1 glutathione S-transferase family protein [Spartinivicinus marinus]NYZ64613.1 glutathione S-transferase family protein [Spartinivicinus marinus]
MKLYYHPLSTYSQKVLIAFYEKEVEFTPYIVNLMDEASKKEYKEIYPLGKIPLLMCNDDHMIPESTIIIEYLDTHFSSGTRLIPEDKDAARQVRFIDRVQDNYLNDNIATLFFESMKPAEKQDSEKQAKAKEQLDIMYHYMNKQYSETTFAKGDDFTMADCSAVPALFYAQKIYPFEQFEGIKAYYKRVSERPSYQKVLAEAQPYLEKMFS